MLFPRSFKANIPRPKAEEERGGERGRKREGGRERQVKREVEREIIYFDCFHRLYNGAEKIRTHVQVYNFIQLHSTTTFERIEQEISGLKAQFVRKL